MGNPARNFNDFAGNRSVYDFVKSFSDLSNYFLSVFCLVKFMGILDRLSDKYVWEEFFEYKVFQGNLRKNELEDFRSFIDNGEYQAVVNCIEASENLSSARKILVNKSKAGRKRTVYTFSREENYVLKLIQFLLFEYDELFADNLYSFRKYTGVKKATDKILRIKNLDKHFVYKVDISDYFNSVDVGIILPELKNVFSEDIKLFEFFERILTYPYVEYNGELIEEKRGIMAGVPIASFLANFYLRELDWYFYNKNIPYMRYSDDIIVFAETEKDMLDYIDKIKSYLVSRKLIINPEKEVITKPHEKWTFLGFSYQNGIIDISDISFNKLKAKMRRKTKALHRWAEKKNLPGEYAAKAFVKRFNAKLYDNYIDCEMTWTRWYFPVINTSETLKLIDEYMQYCIRCLATGKRTKSRFNFRYDDIKKLGYRSLVNEYYKFTEITEVRE